MQQDNDTPTLPEFAPHDPDVVLAPGLFRSLPHRKDARKNRLEVNYVAGERRVTFKSPDLLGAEDMRVLQGLMAVAMGWEREDWLKIDEPREAVGEQLALRFDAQADMYNRIALKVRGSFAAVARAVGIDPTTGGAVDRIRESIERLSGLTVIAEDRRGGGSCHFLSSIWGDRAERAGAPGGLLVALNPRLADMALYGRDGGGKFIRIALSEVRALKSGAARLIHQRLCGWIDAGKSGRVGIDTLCSYVWPDEAGRAATRRQRRYRARRALRELEAFERPWTVTEYAPGKLEIGRPARLEVEVRDA